MRIRTALILVLALALLPSSASAASTSFGALARAARSTPSLAKQARRARAQYRGHRTCASLRTLGTVVERARRLPSGALVARRARALQHRIFVRAAAGHGRCGLRAPTFRVNPRLRAEQPGAVRVAGPHATTDFVADELVLEGSDDAAARFAARWHGRVVRTVSRPGAPTFHLLRVDPSGAPLGRLAADLEILEPAASGRFQVSSASGLRLLAVAADGAAHGLKVGANAITHDTSILSGSTAEAPPIDGWDPDAFSWWQTRQFGVGDAWRAMALSGKDANRVKLAVLDNGFAPDPIDLRDGADGADGVRNPVKCSEGLACPWHGTGVVSAAAALIDNGVGAAGTGGQVATPIMLHNGSGSFSVMDSVYAALDRGAKVINISQSFELDAAIGFVNLPYEDSTQTAREQGTLVVASAGNEGRDVDAEDCFVFCWEEEKIVACENDGVTCVGSVDADGVRAKFSNYGKESCGAAQECDVDIFGPSQVWVGPDPDTPQPHRVAGTSVSTPYVAGVAAMLMAADPSLSADDVENALLSGADPSEDFSVSRTLDAMGALRRVLPSIPMKVQITDAADTPYGGFGTTLKAQVFALGSCAGCKVTWSSDKDGALGSGKSVEAAFPSPGKRVVTATVTDPTGATASDHATLTATNAPPAASFDTSNYHYYAGQPFKPMGRGTDPNVLGDLPCSALSWTLDDQPVGTGCAPTLSLPKPGLHELRLTVTDGQGATGTIAKTLTADYTPPNTPPFVTITSPDRGDNLDPGTPVTLTATATDPDTGKPLTGTWSVRVDGKTTPIGPGNTRTWKPGDDVGFHCGGADVTLVFSATDADGTSSDELPVKVAYGIC
jgi:serine protease